LDTYGAVSEETVIEMAEGLLDISRACITVAISGIAGPDGGSDDKPVGLIYVCLNDGNKHYIRKLNFARERNYNRTYACLHALDMLRRYLTKCL
jgi:nicotinamide-nucleotide amidase